MIYLPKCVRNPALIVAVGGAKIRLIFLPAAINGSWLTFDRYDVSWIFTRIDSKTGFQMAARKRAVVTGGNRGIGLAIARMLAEEGYDLILCARNESTLRQARHGILEDFPAAEVIIRPVDLSVKKQVVEFANFVRQTWSGLDVLVNNAGNFVPGSVLAEEDGSLEMMIETNLYSAYYLTRELFPMLDTIEGGYIFNICSIASLKAYPNGGSYGISKFAMLGWSKNLREECKKNKVKVTAIMPGATYTESWQASGLPEERFMQAEDVASVVLNALRLSPAAVVEEIIIRPQQGDI